MNKPQLLFKFGDHETSNGIVYYNIYVVSNQTNQKKEVKWRYSEMRQIHQILQKKVKKPKNMPIFPSKKWFGNTQQNFINQRKVQLQYYFNNLLKQYTLQQIDNLNNLLIFQEDQKKTEFKRENSDILKKQSILNQELEKLTLNYCKKYIEMPTNEEFQNQESINNKLSGFNKLKLKNNQNSLLTKYRFPFGKEVNLAECLKEEFHRKNYSLRGSVMAIIDLLNQAHQNKYKIIQQFK